MNRARILSTIFAAALFLTACSSRQVTEASSVEEKSAVLIAEAAQPELSPADPEPAAAPSLTAAAIPSSAPTSVPAEKPISTQVEEPVTEDDELPMPEVIPVLLITPQQEPELPPACTPAPVPEATAAPAPTPDSSPVPTPSPTPAPAPAFNVSLYVSYAISYGSSLGLLADSSATACWDDPLAAHAGCIYLERDIRDRLDWYKAGGFTAFWTWSEDLGGGNYSIYIGYA